MDVDTKARAKHVLLSIAEILSENGFDIYASDHESLILTDKNHYPYWLDDLFEGYHENSLANISKKGEV